MSDQPKMILGACAVKQIACQVNSYGKKKIKCLWINLNLIKSGFNYGEGACILGKIKYVIIIMYVT